MAESKIKLKKIEDNLYELDVRGMVCPFPQILIIKALENLAENDILEVFIDNPPSVRDIPPALERKGYKSEVIKVDKIISKIVIQAKKE